MAYLGNQLSEFCSSAKEEIILVAPFIKISAFRKITSSVGEQINLTCVTRWRVEEIARDVNDLEIWPLIKDRPKSTLWLRPDLHAKYYRADDQCLIGSANLTGAALGWSRNPNLEILYQVANSSPQLQGFEESLFSSSIKVTDEIYEMVLEATQELKEKQPDLISVSSDHLIIFDDLLETPINPKVWLPTLRHPENLFKAYIGQLDDLGSASQDKALKDLIELPVAPGLSQDGFEICVGALLLQKPLIQSVDLFVERPQRFGSVTDLLDSLPCAEMPEFDAKISWQTLMRWLRYFLPNRYALSVPNYSEVFYKVGK